MIILGIDTAIRCTGYAVLEFSGSDRAAVLDCGLIKNSQKAPHSECLRRIAGGMRELVAKFHPDCAAIEDAFVSKNIRTAMILSYARGAAMSVLAENMIPIYAYSPKKAKLAVTGRGDASKEQVALILASMFGLDQSLIPADSTDAISLAACHGQIASRPGGKELLGKAV